MSETHTSSESIYNLQSVADRFIDEFQHDPSFLGTHLEAERAIFDNPDALQRPHEGKVAAISPVLLTNIAYTSTRVLKRAFRSEAGQTIQMQEVNEARDRSMPMSAGITAATALEALHENGIVATGQGLESHPDLDVESLLDPAAAKQNAIRMMASLVARAEHVGVTNDNIPELIYLAIQVPLVGKRAFTNRMAEQLGRVRAVNYSHDKTAMTLDSAISDAFQPGNIHMLGNYIKNAKQQLTNGEDAYWISSMLIRNMLVGWEYAATQENQSATQDYCRFLLQPEQLERVLPATFPKESAADTEPTLPDPFEFSANTEVDWTILPPGKLLDKAREIVGNSRSKKEVKIDLDRLKSLEEIRQAWGADRCYYTTAALRNNRIIRDGDQECPDEYILLVLQEMDDDNTITGEHAVAESPIAGPHAMYVYRQDVGEGFSWRDVMAMPKEDARMFNARALKHRTTGATMSEKAMALLTCDKDRFLELRFDQVRGFSLPKSVVELNDQDVA